MNFHLAYFEGGPVVTPGREPFPDDPAKLRCERFGIAEAAMDRARELFGQPHISGLELRGEGGEVVLNPDQMADELRARRR